MDSTLEEKQICEGVADKLLDTKVSDIHIAEIASDLKEWEVLAPNFSLTESEQKEICEDFQGRYNLQKRKALQVWRWKNGDKATYRNLVSICCSQGLISLAEAIARYPGSKRPRSSELLDGTFYQYLLDCYRGLPHPSSQQWPSRLLSCPVHIPTKFFDLRLHEAPLYEVSDKRLPSKLVSLSDVLTKDHGERLLVYFEGIAGSGKTTLSWHACREWAEKRLLGQFRLLIHVQLNNPQVQSVASFPDIIPYPDKTLRQQIATAIVDQQGQGVCFLLDGLDEAPTSLLDFLFEHLINGKLGYLQMPGLSFVMTSRPDSRVTKRLEFVIESRIIVAGFNRENLHQFLEDSLGAGSKEKTKILEEFTINPRLEGLCSHPINIVIMSFLIYFIKEKIPMTQTDLYKPLICNYLVRHMDTRSNEEEPVVIDHLIDDSLEIGGPFRELCSLAYSFTIKSKRLYTMKEIGQAIDNSLGLLQVHPVITMFGSERFYSFPHLSLQEFLAAVHLSKMRRDDQASAVTQILSKNPQSHILPFYAGLTGLINKRVIKSMSKALSQAAENHIILGYLLQEKGDPQQKILTFFKCLFECQNESLFQMSETNLSDAFGKRFYQEIQNDLKEMKVQTNTYEDLPLLSVSLYSFPLTPIDCLSLGYYINKKSCFSTPQTMQFNLCGCSIDHIGFHILFTELKKNINHRTPVGVQLQLNCNKFDNESLLSLKELLQGQSNLEGLILLECFDPSVVDICYALKCLIEGLANNSSCEDLSLSMINCSYYIHYFVLMLRACPQIHRLSLLYSDLSKAIPLLFSAVILTVNPFHIDISFCNISDSDLILLGKMVSKVTLGTKNCLRVLNVSGNPITHNGLSIFLRLLQENPLFTLNLFGVDLEFNSEQNQILKEINQFRTFLNLRPLVCKPSYQIPIFRKLKKDSETLYHTRQKLLCAQLTQT